MDMDMMSDYEPPKALTILAGIFLALGAIFMVIVLADIVVRQGWKSMMLIMIPVYPINAGYMPLSLYIYWKYGRPTKPAKSVKGPSGEEAAGHEGMAENTSEKEEDLEAGHGHEHHGSHEDHGVVAADAHGDHEHHHGGDSHDMMTDMGEHGHMHNDHTNMDHSKMDHSKMDHAGHESAPAAKSGHDMHAMHNMHDMHNMHMPSPDRPMWVTVATGVMHCGAGCVLGDLVGEWLVYGTGVAINGHDVWPCLLIDYAFALLFGIAFQYFSIAPMSGDYGLKTVWRAAKADILSLTFFEIGLFGWMVAYQVGIWDYQLEMNTWTYWWMMQVGMLLGFITAFPINWWLISAQIKEPCA